MRTLNYLTKKHMKYKVKQSLQINLENELNEEVKGGYKWLCKLFSWDTEYNGGKMKLITYLLTQ